MSLQRSYLQAVAHQLQHHAVWEPGDPVTLADFGHFVGGAFKKLGSIADFGIEMQPERSRDSFWEFSSAGVRTNLIAASGEVPGAIVNPALAATSLHGTLEVTFRDRYSLFFRASKCVWTQIKNVREVALAARARPDWDFGWCIVSGIREAGNLLVLMNEQSGSSVMLHAEMKTLLVLQKEGISARTGIEVEGDAALKIIGKKGPFLLDIIRLNRFPIFGQIRHASGGALPSLFDEPDVLDDPYTVVQPSATLDYD